MFGCVSPSVSVRHLHFEQEVVACIFCLNKVALRLSIILRAALIIEKVTEECDKVVIIFL